MNRPSGTYDVVFIGGGGASYPGAFELAKRGHRVLVVDDKGVLGGVCLYAGCVPSKALRRWALAVRDAEVFGNAKVDPDDIWRRAIEAKESVQKEVFGQLDWLARQLGESLDFVKGWASIRDERNVVVRTDEGEFNATTKFIHLGAGSVDVIPPGLQGAELALTSDDLYAYGRSLRDLPDSMVIVGAGYVGVETAVLLSMFKVKVTLVEMMDRPLPNMPMDISRSVLRGLQRLGVTVHLGARASSIERKGSSKVLRAIKRDGSALELEADEVMLAVGRRPRLEGYGIESLAARGLKYSRDGVSVDEYMRTSLPNVFAAGDVIGGAMLYHAALVGSLVAARNMEAGTNKYRYNPMTIPRVVFTHPEAGYVGYTEEQLKQAGVGYTVIRYSMKANSYSLIEGMSDAWVKVIVSKEDGRVLGAQAYAPEAHSILAAFALGLMRGLGKEDFYWLAAPHPSPIEALPESFRMAELLD
jgi:dihydrolipoamide dehydrogenase